MLVEQTISLFLLVTKPLQVEKRKHVFFVLVILLSYVALGYSQVNISGVVNQYTKVVSVDGPDRITVANASAFHPKDTTLIVQMKGVSILHSNDNNFGSVQDINATGKYEFIIIDTIIGDQIIFMADLVTTYEPDAFVQLVRVPGYSNARVTGTLTCAPWDSAAGTGGVLAILVGNTLTLNADIDVTGKGFAGGAPVDGNGECSAADTAYKNYYFSAAADSAGYKGEGLASFAFFTTDHRHPLSPDFVKGRGRLFTGGGGGNAKYTGGGGGALYGKGGDGGIESMSCLSPGSVVGKGGGNMASGISNWKKEKRIFLGSGGGSGTQVDGLTAATAGGNGGGLVIIMADTLKGNGHVIRADGGSVTAVATAAGGGGGSGGMILLEVNSFGTNTTVSVRGGNGGNTNGTQCSGAGGGGGGGIIWTSRPVSPKLTTVTDHGLGGSSFSGCSFFYQGEDGQDGVVEDSLSVLLTGFLFNSIFSSRTGEYADTICEGEKIPKILGSAPKGGKLPYTYSWEVSNDGVNWSILAGEMNKDLDLGIPLFDTTYYRRTVTDNSSPAIKDVSKVLTIVVQPEIEHNRLQFDTIICAGQQPPPLQPFFPSPVGGDGTYAYVWEESTDGVSFQPAQGVNDAAFYQPPVLNDTVMYRRWVFSGKCSNISDTVTIAVLPVIGNNAIGADTTICEGYTFDQLTGTVPTGGDGSYSYLWIESADGNTWGTGYGPHTAPAYQPDTASLLFPGQAHFRRVVLSGLNNTCVDTSNEVLLTQYPAITNNNIAADQHICEGEVPVPLTGDPPGGGDNTYTYLWLQSFNGITFSPASGANTDIGYAPPALTDTVFYQRVVYSSVCRDTSPVVKITVDPAIRNYGIQTLSGGMDTTVCAGVPVNRLVPAGTVTGGNGIYAYDWQSSEDNGATWSSTGGTAEDHQPSPLAVTTLFRRQVTSGVCSVVSDTVTFTVLPALANNVLPADYSVCDGDSTLIDGTLPTGGDGIYNYLWEESSDGNMWNIAAGTGDGEDYRSPALSSPVYFRRVVTSGPGATCRDTALPVHIGIYPLPSALLLSLDTTVCSGSPVTLTVQVTGENGPWSLAYEDGQGGGDTTHIMGAGTVPLSVIPETQQAQQSFTYKITSLTDAHGCEAPPVSLPGEARVVADGIPVADAGSDDEVCGLSYSLRGVAPTFGQALWIVPVTLSITDTTDPHATITAGDEGTYQITWQVTNGVCPAVSDMINLTLWEEPGDVTAGADTSLEPGTFEVNLQATWQEPHVGTLTWSTTSSAVIDDVNSELIHVSSLPVGESVFRVEVANGVCPVKQDEVIVMVPDFSAHNYGISPNNDGINDHMIVPGAENVPNTLVIFDAHGTVVFRTDNFMHADNVRTVDGWNGVNNDGEPLADGTYYYILEMKGDIRQTLKGFIVIKRSPGK